MGSEMCIRDRLPADAHAIEAVLESPDVRRLPPGSQAMLGALMLELKHARLELADPCERERIGLRHVAVLRSVFAAVCVSPCGRTHTAQSCSKSAPAAHLRHPYLAPRPRVATTHGASAAASVSSAPGDGPTRARRAPRASFHHVTKSEARHVPAASPCRAPWSCGERASTCRAGGTNAQAPVIYRL